MFLVHFQQPSSKNYSLDDKLGEFNWELGEFLARTRRVFLSGQFLAFEKQVCIKYSTNKPRLWYHWWVLSILTLPKCTCNPNKPWIYVCLNTCKIWFPRFIILSSIHGNFNPKRIARNTFLVVDFDSLKPCEPSTPSVLPQMLHTTPNAFGMTLERIHTSKIGLALLFLMCSRFWWRICSLYSVENRFLAVCSGDSMSPWGGLDESKWKCNQLGKSVRALDELARQNAEIRFVLLEMD